MMDDYRLREIEGKKVHDPYRNINSGSSKRCVFVRTPVIIGAGPSGLAAAACLGDKGVPSLVLERSNCIASLWKLKTYDRLKLHLPKQFCELPFMPFPEAFPDYPTKQQFIQYLEAYANRFQINPVFNQQVVRAEFDENLGFWRLTTTTTTNTATLADQDQDQVEYLTRWLVVATGENAEEAVPAIEGMEEFGGAVTHTSGYKSGEAYKGRKVLVVGCGNSGMEVCLDLCNYDARPSLVVRDAVHILPREMLGTSTFGLSMFLLKWLPVRLVDLFLLAVSRLMLGDTARFGLNRPSLGPLEVKNQFGKTPVLDVGTLDKIKAKEIQIRPGIKKLMRSTVEFEDGRIENYDSIILATGYKSNVPSWLKENDMFSKKDGLPKEAFPNGWKGRHGLYSVGLTKRGLVGTSMDANNIAEDIGSQWRSGQGKEHSDIIWLAA